MKEHTFHRPRPDQAPAADGPNEDSKQQVEEKESRYRHLGRDRGGGGGEIESVSHPDNRHGPGGHRSRALHKGPPDVKERIGAKAGALRLNSCSS